MSESKLDDVIAENLTLITDKRLRRKIRYYRLLGRLFQLGSLALFVLGLWLDWRYFALVPVTLYISWSLGAQHRLALVERKRRADDFSHREMIWMKDYIGRLVETVDAGLKGPYEAWADDGRALLELGWMDGER